MRSKLLSALAATLVAGTLAASPPEKVLRNIRVLSPDAANDIEASVQVLEWEDGTKSIARRMVVSHAPGDLTIDWQIDPVNGRFSARQRRVSADRSPFLVQTNVQPPATGGSGYDLSWTFDQWDHRGYHANRTIVGAGWTECPTSTSSYVTITPELNKFFGAAQAINPGFITLGSWKLDGYTLSPPTPEPRTLAVYPQRKSFEIGVNQAQYVYDEAGPTDVPQPPGHDATMNVRLNIFAAAWGDTWMYVVLGWTGPDPTNDRDTISFTPRAPGIACPSPGDGDGGGWSGGGCIDGRRFCEQMESVSFCTPVLDAGGQPAGTCCGNSTEDVVACAASRFEIPRRAAEPLGRPRTATQ